MTVGMDRLRFYHETHQEGESMLEIQESIPIKSRNFWVKVVECLQQNWALIEHVDGKGVTIYFLGDTGGVFDTIAYPNANEAEYDLLENGFERFDDNPNLVEFLAPPQPPFVKRQHPNGPIYSSGRYWKRNQCKINYKRFGVKTEKQFTLIGLGWDVGGWQGRKQGFAAYEWDSEVRKIRAIGNPFAADLRSFGNSFSPDEILKRLGFQRSNSKDITIVVGIDAPLGWPKEYQDLVAGITADDRKMLPPSREIDNSFAYRATERYLFETYGKKPLSATFDKLGNNATVAICAVNAWMQCGYHLMPKISKSVEKRSIIEVYPGIEKQRNTIGKNAEIGELIAHTTNEDAYDAQICALLALSMADSAAVTGLHRLVEPPNNPIYCQEGWIYHWA